MTNHLSVHLLLKGSREKSFSIEKSLRECDNADSFLSVRTYSCSMVCEK